MKKSLTRVKRLPSRIEIAEIFKSDIKYEYNGLKILVKKTGLSFNRFAVVLRRGIRSAVNRNREKRVVKEAFRSINARLLQGNDIVIIIKNRGIAFSERVLQLELIFRKINILHDSSVPSRNVEEK